MKLITGDVWKYVNTKLAKRSLIKCAIAYVTSKNLPLKRNDILICDATEGAIKSGETSAAILEYYFKKGVIVYSRKQLHAKVLHTKDFVVVGSANASENSIHLVEASLYTVDRISNNQVNAFIHGLIDKLFPLSDTDIQKLKSIPVVKRKFFSPGARVGTTTYGKNSWVIPVGELSQKIVDENEDFIETTTEQAAELAQVAADDIQFIRCTGRGRLRMRNCKVGDQVLQLWTPKNEKQNLVRSFCAIIKIVRKANELWVFYDSSDLKEISWKLFERRMDRLELKRPIKKASFRSVDDNDSILISTVFK